MYLRLRSITKTHYQPPNERPTNPTPVAPFRYVPYPRNRTNPCPAGGLFHEASSVRGGGRQRRLHHTLGGRQNHARRRRPAGAPPSKRGDSLLELPGAAAKRQRSCSACASVGEQFRFCFRRGRGGDERCVAPGWW